jgi:Helix-turn-helix domain
MDRRESSDGRQEADGPMVTKIQGSIIESPPLAGRAAYSIAECCALTGFGRDKIYAAIRAGALVGRKLGRRTVVTAPELRRFLEKLPRAGR